MPSFDKKPEEDPLETSAKSDGPFAGASVWERVTSMWPFGHPIPAQSPVESSPVSNALTSVTKNLEGGLLEHFFGPSEKQAGQALDALTKLPPEQQGEAVAKLTPSQLQSLVKNTSIEDREHLLGLVENTTDPARKLELFSAYHKAHATLDAKRTKDTDPSLTQEQRAARGRVRSEAAAGTSAELDDEMQYLKTKEGGFTANDVDELMRRKSAEHDIEMKHAVKLTNQTELRQGVYDDRERRTRVDQKSHVHFSEEELRHIDYSLEQAPKEHLEGLGEIRRDTLPRPNMVKDASMFQDRSADSLNVLDRGQQKDVYPNSSSIGEQRQLANDDDNRPIHRTEFNLSHELGHRVADKNKEVYGKYFKAGGWKMELDADGRPKTNPTTGGPQYTPGPGAVPGPETAGTKNVTDPYAYGRTDPGEMFAEHYAKATHEPEKLHADMVSGPRKATKNARDNLAEAKQQRIADLATGHPAMTAAEWDAEIKNHEKNVSDAESAERMRKDQFDIMRNDVFGTDKAQVDSEARLSARGLDVEQMKAFREQAAEASTPAQLKRLEERFMQAPPGRLPKPAPAPTPWKAPSKKPAPTTAKAPDATPQHPRDPHHCRDE